MANVAPKRPIFERFFETEPGPQRSAEVLSEQALFARYWLEGAANDALVATPEPAPAPVTPPPSIQPVEAVPAEAGLVEVEPVPVTSFFERVKQGLSRTRDGFSSGLSSLLAGKKAIDDDLLEELETQLLMADVGVDASRRVLDAITERMGRKELRDSEALYEALQQELAAILATAESSQGLVIDTSKKPFVVLMIGVNGVGKTTTIGKLAKKLQQQGKSVMLAAGDTFRAAAVEQLQVWGERNDIPVVAQHTGADSASVIYDALESARAKGVDVLIADTAGRLHTKSNLMDELAKVKRVMAKLDPEAPHEAMLVLDACTGQNALNQAQQFNQAVGVTGITLTKLDGTAKGGIVFAIAHKLALPIRYIGVGESIDDLRPFEPEAFVKALFDR